jgi:uncharacterized protein (TIGR02145 family)
MKSFKKNIFRSDEDTSALCLNCSPHDVIIGTQTWTGCNATISTYSNGDPIPYIDNPTTWSNLTTGAWCYYNNDPSTEATYGKLYNYYAITDSRNIAPSGYHVPTDSEWATLISQVGGTSAAGGNMKEVGLCHWTTPNTGATNTSQFTGLPGGVRNLNGSYSNIGNDGYWWSFTELGPLYSWYRTLRFNDATANKSSGNKAVGFSLRFIKDVFPTCPDVQIGLQVWAGCNLNIEKFRDGTLIPYIGDDNAWMNATGPAWCYYNSNEANGPVYGKLYNGYAILDTIHGGIAPVGYHIPTEAEWETLKTTVGGGAIAGGPLKATTLWNSPNTGATNSSGFTAYGGGYRSYNLGTFYSLNDVAYMWKLDPSGSPVAQNLYYNSVVASSTGFPFLTAGASVRLIKD